MKSPPWYYITHSLTPIPFLVWRFISFLFGTEQTFFFHLTNIIIHAVNGFLVWKISKLIFSKKENAQLLSYLVASLFILHPVQVESVIWISALRTLLGGTFSFLSLYNFLLYMNKKKGQRDFSTLILSYIFMFLIIFTYPPMISIALTFPFFSILRGHKFKEQFLLRKDKAFISTTGLILVFMALTFFIHQSNILSKSFAITSVDAYIQLILSTLGQYTINALIPLKLYFDYQINPLTLNYLEEDLQLNHAFYAGLFGVITTISFLILEKMRRLGYIIICFTIFLLPNLGIIHHDFHNISTVADRYLYLSIFPYALILILAFKRLESYLRKKNIFNPLINTLGLSLFTLLCFSLLSLHQVGLWGNQKEFLARSTPKAQLSIPLLISLGNLYREEGQYKKATSYYQEVLTSDPTNISAFTGLINIFFENPNTTSAERVIFLIQGKIIVPTADNLVSIAKIFYFMKDYESALTFAKKSLFLGIRTKEAKEIMELAADFKKIEVRDHLDRLFKIYYRTNNYQIARQLNNERLRLYPENHDYLEMKELLIEAIKNK